MSQDNNDFSNDIFNITNDEASKTRKPIKDGTYSFEIVEVQVNETKGWWFTLLIQEGEYQGEKVWLGIPLNVKTEETAIKQKRKLTYLLWAAMGEKPKAMKKNQIVKALQGANVKLAIWHVTPGSKFWSWMVPFEENGIG